MPRTYDTFKGPRLTVQPPTAVEVALDVYDVDITMAVVRDDDGWFGTAFLVESYGARLLTTSVGPYMTLEKLAEAMRQLCKPKLMGLALYPKRR
jgi:hypothetical protein